MRSNDPIWIISFLSSGIEVTAVNTQMLQHHLETSLTELACACCDEHRTSECDELMIRILSDADLDDARRIGYIQEIDALKGTVCPAKTLHIELNLQAFYERTPAEWAGRDKVWKGLQNIALCVRRRCSSSHDTSMLEFLYRSLRSINNPERQPEILKEIEIVSGLYEN